MKIRSELELTDLLDRDLTWRRTELSHIKASIEKLPYHRHERDALTRGGVALLYAHWEGYVRNAARNYLNYINTQRITHCNLAPSLRALVFCKIHEKDKSKGKILKLISPILHATENTTDKLKIDYETAIDTKSNLNSEVFAEIAAITQVGIEQFEEKFYFIDSQLLAKRNSIAHGEHNIIDYATYLQFHNNTIGLISLYNNALQNNIATRAYKKL